ncbi:MAG: histidine kinase [Planctomycetaceae bacterium]|nr:histidine kinase [Planctomycetaceae bacterium]
MAFVYVIQGFDQGVRKDIAGNVFTIGRDSTNHLQLHDSEVSRFHAEIHAIGDQFEIRDLKSSNGIFRNGELQERFTLNTGDHLQFGRTHLIFTTRSQGKHADLSSEIQLDMNEKGASRILESARPRIPMQDPFEIESGLLDYEDAIRHLQVMYQTTMAVSQTLDIDQLLERLIDLIFSWVEADRGCIILLDGQTERMIPKVSRYKNVAAEGDGMIISKRILEYVIEHQEGVLTSDAREDERWEAAGSIVGKRIKEAICVPLTGRYGVVGVIYVDTSLNDSDRIVGNEEQHFSHQQLKLMVAIAHQAALAIEDTRYYSSMLQAERLAAMGQTVTAISHHIKNIIQGVNGGSYLVEEGLKSKDFSTLFKGWDIVQRNQKRISELVLDMLTFSKERRPEVTSANLNRVAEDVLDILRPRAQLERTELVFQPVPGIHQYMFDPNGIHRALLNIVSNAMDAVTDQPDGRVSILVDHDLTSRSLLVVVTDNGPGIPEQMQEQIFHAFTSGKGGQGTGLGLAVSRKIIREHDGDITINSDGICGSSFKLQWPSVSPTERAEQLRDSSVSDQNRII